MIGPIGRRLHALIGLAIGLAAISIATAAMPFTAGASTYGTLLARDAAAPSTPLASGFARAAPPNAFVLVVTEPSRAQLTLKWSLHCASASNRERGGATGAATVSTVRWVKRVRADWIKHAATCSGAITGATGASPALVRVFAQRA